MTIDQAVAVGYLIGFILGCVLVYICIRMD